MSVDFQKLLSTADENDKAELKLAHNGRIEAMQAYQKKPGKATKDDLAAARDFYDETVERMIRRYFPEDVPAPEGELFKNRKQAHDWLIDQGYQVAQRTFYNACDAGFPEVRKDKTVSRFQVLQYAQGLGRESGGGSSELAKRKELADVKRAEADARIKERQDEREKRELDRAWVRREDADEEICVWTGRLRDAITYHLSKNSTALIHACGGQLGRLAEVQEIIDDAIAAGCNEIADADDITVTIEDLEEEEAV